MTKLIEISRGVADTEAAATFYSRLLGVRPIREEAGWRFPCAGGSLVIHGNRSVPIAMAFSDAGVPFRGSDPDGVPIAVTPGGALASQLVEPGSSVGLDHVQLNCGDLGASMDFYRELAFSVTWSGREGVEIDGPQASPVDGATWVHLSCDSGYLSLAQAAREVPGGQGSAPEGRRLVHIGLAVDDLAAIVERLDQADVTYTRRTNAVGQSLYVNDPDALSDYGENIEIIEYLPGVQHSGTQLAASAVTS